jgi:hypothetical protein
LGGFVFVVMLMIAFVLVLPALAVVRAGARGTRWADCCGSAPRRIARGSRVLFSASTTQ